MQGRAGMLEALQAATKRVEADKTFAPTIDASAEATARRSAKAEVSLTAEPLEGWYRYGVTAGFATR